MAQTRQLAAQRLDQLRDLIRQRGVLRIEQLCRQLHVSPATARRDLDALERAGTIRRVHGGAVSVETRLEEPLFDNKTTMAAREKHRIAVAALELVGADETVYLDGGSTVLELARLLRDRTSLTVVTNSLRAAIELAGRGPRLILIGGELRRLSQTLVGPLTRAVLEQLHFDKAFMGTMGLALQEGLTTTDPSEAFTKEQVLGRARRVIVLADSGKAGRVLFAHAGRWDQVHTLITDTRLDVALARALKKKGIEVIQT